jgi:hypothetical protein
MKSNEVGTTLKHPETINGNVKNLSKRMKMKDKGECHFYDQTGRFDHKPAGLVINRPTGSVYWPV